MKCNTGKSITVLTFFALAVVCLAPAVHAQCSLAGAVGKYGFSDSGTVIGVGPRAAVGSLTFTPGEKLFGVVTANVNGGLTKTVLSGTYSVDPSCSGTATFSEFDKSGCTEPCPGTLILSAQVAIAWDKNMQQARFLFMSVVLPDGTPLPVVANGDATKVIVPEP